MRSAARCMACPGPVGLCTWIGMPSIGYSGNSRLLLHQILQWRCHIPPHTWTPDIRCTQCTATFPIPPLTTEQQPCLLTMLLYVIRTDTTSVRKTDYYFSVMEGTVPRALECCTPPATMCRHDPPRLLRLCAGTCDPPRLERDLPVISIRFPPKPDKPS